MAKINFIRLYPYGGGSNLALIQSLNKYSKHYGDIYTKTKLSQVCSSCADDFVKFKIKSVSTVNFRVGFNLVSFIKNFYIEHGTELIDIAEPANGYSFQLTKEASKHRIPVVITSIETIRYPGTKLIPSIRLYTSYVKRKATHFRVFTTKSKCYLESLGVPSHKISKIPLGIDTDLFSPSFDKDDSRVKILFSRKLEHKNGILDLLMATKILSKRGYRISLMVVGDGPLTNVVSSMSRFYPIKLFGQVPYYQLAALYKDIDIYCNPAFDKQIAGSTFQEDGQYTFPLLESQAAGLPLLTTQSGSNNELVNRRNPIIPQHSLEDLVDSLEYLMEENLRKEIGTENRRFIVNKYNASALQADSDLFYQKILNEDFE